MKKLKGLLVSSVLVASVAASATHVSAAPTNKMLETGVLKAKAMMNKVKKKKDPEQERLKQAFHEEMQRAYDDYSLEYEHMGVEQFVSEAKEFMHNLLERRDHELRVHSKDAVRKSQIIEEARQQYEQYLADHDYPRFKDFQERFTHRLQETRENFAAQGFKDKKMPVDIPGMRHVIEESVGEKMERITTKIAAMTTKMKAKFNGPDNSNMGLAKNKVMGMKEKYGPKIMGLFGKHK